MFVRACSTKWQSRTVKLLTVIYIGKPQKVMFVFDLCYFIHQFTTANQITRITWLAKLRQAWKERPIARNKS